ncbi:MAG: type II secretion system F family protein, partial [Candidatus Pacebacteria bacterium]|nr:type II secretion system F family protein [Candidatus Paceibacterota bacterium]
MIDPKKNITFFSHVSDQDRMLLAKHLAMMSKSGISLAESVKVLIQQTRPGAFKDILQSVLNDLENGQPLAKSLARYPKAFSPFFTNLIEIGEASGNFSKNLAYLADQLRRDHAFRAKIRSATMYPMIVICLAVAVGIGVSVFALPQLINMFESFSVPLPLNTRILIWFATVMQKDGIAIVIAILALIVLFRILLRIRRVRLAWGRFVLRLPAIGPLVEDTQLTFLCRNLGVMLQGGIPIATALDIQVRNTENPVYQDYLIAIRKAVGGGMTMTSTFSSGKNQVGIPPIFIKMVDIGDTSGKLEESLLYLSDFFEAEVDDLTTNISALMEP